MDACTEVGGREAQDAIADGGRESLEARSPPPLRGYRKDCYTFGGTNFPAITERPQAAGKKFLHFDYLNCLYTNDYIISNFEAASASALVILFNSRRIDSSSFVL